MRVLGSSAGEALLGPKPERGERKYSGFDLSLHARIRTGNARVLVVDIVPRASLGALCPRRLEAGMLVVMG